MMSIAPATTGAAGWRRRNIMAVASADGMIQPRSSTQVGFRHSEAAGSGQSLRCGCDVVGDRNHSTRPSHAASKGTCHRQGGRDGDSC